MATLEGQPYCIFHGFANASQICLPMLMPMACINIFSMESHIQRISSHFVCLLRASWGFIQ